MRLGIRIELVKGWSSNKKNKINMEPSKDCKMEKYLEKEAYSS